jgi:hypothetical protein
MIHIEIDNSNEGIEMFFDSSGIDELIRYLMLIREKNDHIHLIVGNELSEGVRTAGDKLVKHAKLIYEEE